MKLKYIWNYTQKGNNLHACEKDVQLCRDDVHFGSIHNLRPHLVA